MTYPHLPDIVINDVRGANHLGKEGLQVQAGEGTGWVESTTQLLTHRNNLQSRYNYLLFRVGKLKTG